LNWKKYGWKSKDSARKDPETGFVAVGDARVGFSVVRSRKRKRTIAFKMERDATLRIMAPVSTSLGYLTRLAQSRAPWVAQKLAEHAALPQNSFTDGSILPYLGRPHILCVTQGGGTPQSCILSPHRIHVHVPDETLSPEHLREEIRLEILLWLKKRARVKLKKRLDLWAARLNVRYKKLIVSGPEQRWGSCSADNIVRLNWRLMLAPLAVIDYVVAHELAHIPHKNHGARFWATLEKHMPDCQARRKTLRRIERELVL
jgi:hypothetical protein